MNDPVKLYSIMVLRPGEQAPRPEYFRAGTLVEVEPGRWVRVKPEGTAPLTFNDTQFLKRYGFGS